MVDHLRGVQSYLTSKSSLEQDGYEQAPGTAGARLIRRNPEGVPVTTWATPKKFRRREKASRGDETFCAMDRDG
jgi:hypothetical protein